MASIKSKGCADMQGAISLKILARNAWSVLTFAVKKFFDDRCIITAQALTYSTIFSLIPALVLAFSVFQAFGGIESIEPVLFKYLSEILAPGRQQIVLKSIEGLIQKAQESPIGVFSTFFFLVIAMLLLIELEDSLNHIWGTKGHRAFWQRIAVYFAAFTLAPVLIASPVLVGIFITSYDDSFIFFRYLPLVKLLRIAPIMSIWIFLFSIYFFLPNSDVKIDAAAIGTLAGGSLWLIAAKLYTIYTKNVFIYSMLYGSIGSIPVFLLWLFISWAIILFGVEISYSFQHHHSLTTMDAI
ncbi:MAG: YihY/virulence factor BrkB family protein [Dissulfurimicrobium sp.]|uniref:YihY/virulence factor BrkB family protein n=1 Tax=Dissulfurimicrobium sp. TaxID=2022436 RepID=UPI00404963BA